MSPGVELFGLNALSCKSYAHAIVYTLSCDLFLAVALERKLSNRAPKQELLDKNILQHG